VHILSRWNPPSGTMEMDTVTSALLLLCRIRCMLFLTVKTCLCELSKRRICSVSPFCQSFSVEAPCFGMPCLVRLSLISCLTTNYAVSPWTLWIVFWLAKTSNKPMFVIPLCMECPHTCLRRHAHGMPCTPSPLPSPTFVPLICSNV